MTVFGVKKDDNIQVVGVRTRAAVAQDKSKTKVATQQKKSSQEEPQQKQDIVTVLKARHSEIVTKPATKTRRISNEFEKTEESLYVSALEDIPSDASWRFSNDSKKSSDVGIFKQPSSTQSSKHDDTIKPNSQEIFQDALDDSLMRADRKLPCGVKHFDRENWNDPYQVSHYAMNIFDYLTQQEHKYQIIDYIPKQPDLSKWMRSLLIDWMVEVQESFELNHETLYLAVKIVDFYLGKEVVSKDSLQLVGAAALLIACKYDVS